LKNTKRIKGKILAPLSTVSFVEAELSRINLRDAPIEDFLID